MPERLDHTSAEAIRRWLADLRVAVADADAVTRDALRPIGRRELGRVLHHANYTDACRRIVDLLDHAEPASTTSDPEPGDPAGNGGAGPIH